MLLALKKTITRPEKMAGLEKEKVPVSVLMNDNRQKILQFIFKFPCTHLHGIARTFKFSINSTRWHLSKLKEVGYITDHKFGNRKIYFPVNSLTKTDINILGLLNDKRFESLYLNILSNPGITQKELIDHLEKKQSTTVDNLNTLEKNQLIYSQKDGIFRRYYSTSKVSTREKLNRRRQKKYRGFLIQVLIHDGVEPEILRTTDIKYHIRIKSGKGRSDLVFYFNPYDRFVK